MSDFSDVERTHNEAVNSCTPRPRVGPYFAVSPTHALKEDGSMQADTATTQELPKLNIPQDLLTEVKRGGPKSHSFGVDGLSKPSLFGRLVEKLIGGKAGAK
jgi:hypothetical protein